MEENTFATSAYIDASLPTVFDYLLDLKNLDEWTLYSRMIERIDESTWRGTASGYQNDLYYHVRKIPSDSIFGIEWHCGFESRKYFQVYPVFLFSADYVEPGTSEKGVYFHWLSFVDPKRRTPMIMQGIETVHTSECRSLKAILERDAGHRHAVRGSYRIATDTIYIDAPLDTAIEYLSDVRNLDDWCHLLRVNGEVSADRGEYLDEYNQKAIVTFTTHDLNNYAAIERDFYYPELGFRQRCPVVLVPCSYAFGDPTARGLILHQITFWPIEKTLDNGKLQIQDFGAEGMNIKRLVEAKAGNTATFARGMSYQPPELVAR